MENKESSVVRKSNSFGMKTVGGQIMKVFLIVFVFSAGYFFGIKGYTSSLNNYPNVVLTREKPEELQDLNFSLFWNVWDTLKNKYYDKDKLIEAKMVYGAIKGMVSGVGDPYTIFLEPSDNKMVEDDLKGGFEGVGIQIGFKGTQLAVIAPLTGSPADKAGIKPGDLILGIKDENKNIDRTTDGITLPDAVSAIRGPRNSTVVLYILREGITKPFEVPIVRETIDVPNVTFEKKGDDGNVALLTVNKFADETKVEWDNAVIEIQKDSAIKYVVVDLRNNPGGYLERSVDLATDFLNIGDVVVIEEDGNKNRTDFKVKDLGKLKNYKTVVLVNGGSASASEILAGALMDHKVAKIVGETSFGKGTIQEAEQVENGAGLHITIAKWLTPNGTWINGKGIKPDIEIKDDPETTDIDEQLEKAIEVVKN